MSLPTYTILELEGMYPDTSVEEAIYAESKARFANLKLVRGCLGTGGAGPLTPISELPDDLCASVDGLLVFRHYLTRQDLVRFPRLKAVVRMGVGYDRLDRVALGERGIKVCNVPDYGTEEIADHAIGLTLALRRGIILHHERQKRGEAWSPVNTPLVARLRGQTFGILGLGRIGTAAALRGKALGFSVVFYDPYSPNGADKSIGVRRVRRIEDLFQQSNVISIHCPHTRETRNLVTASLLGMMQPGSLLINTGRGEVVDIEAVYEALKNGPLAGAGLDVLPVEPVPLDVPRLIQAYRNREDWLEGRVIITPHSAYHSPSSFDDIRTLSAETMRSVLIDGLDTNVIPPHAE